MDSPAASLAVSTGRPPCSCAVGAGAFSEPPFSVTAATPVKPWNSSETRVSDRTGVLLVDGNRRIDGARIVRDQLQAGHLAHADAVEQNGRASQQARNRVAEVYVEALPLPYAAAVCSQ